MAVLSVLSRNFVGKFRLSSPNSLLLRSVLQSNPLKNGLREMGTHKRIMSITPSRFQWKKFKDLSHFYIMLGAIPLGLIVFFVNIFVGPAELAEIPEGYHPQNYEYYSHPVKRWFAKHVYVSEQQRYENMLHYLCEKEEARQMRLIEKKIRKLMSSRGDYKGWYYLPVTGKYHRIVREEMEKYPEWEGHN